MKKSFILLVLLFFSFVNIVLADNVYNKVSSVELFEIEDGVWSQKEPVLMYMGEDISVIYPYGSGLRTLSVYSGVGNEKGLKYSFENTLEDSYVSFFLYNGSVYTISVNFGISFFDEKAKLVELEEDENVVYDDFYVNNDLNNNRVIVLGVKRDFSVENLNCSIKVVDANGVSDLSCTTENLEEMFKENYYNLLNNLNKNYYDKKEDNYVEIKDNKLRFYSDDVFIFEDEPNKNEKFNKVQIVDDKIIAIKNRVLYSGDAGIYSDKIVIYDFDGKVLQEIADNSGYIDYVVNDENKELIILKKYLDGVCSFYYGGNYACKNTFSYDVYELNPKYGDSGVLGNLDGLGDIVTNPETEDIAILLFVVLLIVSFIIIIKRKRIDF